MTVVYVDDEQKRKSEKKTPSKEKRYPDIKVFPYHAASIEKLISS